MAQLLLIFTTLAVGASRTGEADWPVPRTMPIVARSRLRQGTGGYLRARQPAAARAPIRNCSTIAQRPLKGRFTPGLVHFVAMDVTVSGRLEQGRQALEAADWEEARAAFEAALAEEETPDARDGLGLALWFLGGVQDAIAAREQAVEGYAREGRCDDAARLAVWVSHQHLIGGRSSAARGWLARAERVVEGTGTCAGQGWVAVERARHAENLDERIEHARRALTIARDTGDGDLEVFAVSLLGRAEVSAGRRDQGMRLLEEAMAAASAGRVRNVHTLAEAYCNLIVACTGAGDWERAAEWCELVDEFARDRDATPLYGSCRTIHADVLIAKGRWDEAERALQSALDAHARYVPEMGRRPWRRWRSFVSVKVACRRPSSSSSGERSIPSRCGRSPTSASPRESRRSRLRSSSAGCSRPREMRCRPPSCSLSSSTHASPVESRPRRKPQPWGSISSRRARASRSSPHARSWRPLASPLPPVVSTPPAKRHGGRSPGSGASGCPTRSQRHVSSSRGHSRPRHPTSRARRRAPPSRPSRSSAPAAPGTPPPRCCVISVRRRGHDHGRAGS